MTSVNTTAYNLKFLFISPSKFFSLTTPWKERDESREARDALAFENLFRFRAGETPVVYIVQMSNIYKYCPPKKRQFHPQLKNDQSLPTSFTPKIFSRYLPTLIIVVRNYDRVDNWRDNFLQGRDV